VAPKTGIVGPVSFAIAVIAVALLPAAASAHPCATSSSGGSTGFLSLDATTSWAGSLPTGEALADIDCSLSSMEPRSKRASRPPPPPIRSATPSPRSPSATT